ncbi:MAG: hypothetical protein PVJ57_08655 [Phycisphaerae bacterium]|jgi:hypothetical protein
MRVSLVLLAVIAVAMPAMADKILDTSIAAFQSPAAAGARQLAMSTGFEAADGFTTGNINGQAGWSVFDGDTNQIVCNANPADGSMHYRNQYEPTMDTGSLVGAFSPDLGAALPSAHTISVDVCISADGGANYDVAPQAPSQSMLTARVSFDWLGNIFVLDDIGAGLDFQDTGVAWTIGEYKNLTIAIDPVADTADYYYDGTLIYSNCAGLWGGTTTEQVVLLSDNYHGTDVGDFDNLVVTPEPASFLLIGLASLFLRRR